MKISKEQRELLQSCNITDPQIKNFQTYRAREYVNWLEFAPAAVQGTILELLPVAHDLARVEYAQRAVVRRTVPYICGHSSFWGALSYYRHAPSGYLICVDHHHPLAQCPSNTFGEWTVTAIADWL